MIYEVMNKPTIGIITGSGPQAGLVRAQSALRLCDDAPPGHTRARLHSNQSSLTHPLPARASTLETEHSNSGRGYVVAAAREAGKGRRPAFIFLPPA